MKLNKFLDIPKEVSGPEPKLTLIGFEEIFIENYKGILEYEDFYIKLNTHIGIININGFNMRLKQITNEDIIITGKIENIDFENISEEEEI